MIFAHDVTNKNLSPDLNYIVDMIMLLTNLLVRLLNNYFQI